MRIKQYQVKIESFQLEVPRGSKILGELQLVNGKPAMWIALSDSEELVLMDFFWYGNMDKIKSADGYIGTVIISGKAWHLIYERLA